MMNAMSSKIARRSPRWAALAARLSAAAEAVERGEAVPLEADPQDLAARLRAVAGVLSDVSVHARDRARLCWRALWRGDAWPGRPRGVRLGHELACVQWLAHQVGRGAPLGVAMALGARGGLPFGVTERELRRWWAVYRGRNLVLPVPLEQRLWLGTWQVAQLVGVPPSTLRYWVSVGRFPQPQRHGRCLYWTRGVVDEWCEASRLACARELEEVS